MKSPEDRVSAVLACLREHALSGDRYDDLGRETGHDLMSLRGAPTGWEFDVNGLIVKVTAQTKEIRQSESEAFADALRLRDALVTAAELDTPRGELGASSVQDTSFAVVGWLGLVYLIFPTGVDVG
jgi:ATP phosphoribosyltransferase regulatory subunit HisZ